MGECGGIERGTRGVVKMGNKRGGRGIRSGMGTEGS